MFIDKDQVAKAVLSKLHPSGSEEAPAGTPPTEDPDVRMEGFHAATEDIMSAIKSNSPNELFTALKAFMDQYTSQPEEQGGE